MNLKERVEELKRDLLTENGPQIGTMGNFPFAILQYEPEEEFLMRALIADLVTELRQNGWKVKNISLIDLMIKRLQKEGDENIEETIANEKRLFKKGNIKRSLAYLKEMMAHDLEGPDGLAANVIAEINELVKEEEATHTLVFLSRAGALYPFHRTSGLLRFLDGHINLVPVILLYPGARTGVTSLSFMGVYLPDSDYRPRIY